VRFEHINHYRPQLARDAAIVALREDLGVRQFVSGVPRHYSELERLLVQGRSIARMNDFTGGYESTVDLTGQLGIFDHATTFSGRCGTFVLTMPYNSIAGFYRDFEKLTRDYLQTRDSATSISERSDMWRSPYAKNPWKAELRTRPTIKAMVVSDRYKTRENGDFAAVIATDQTLWAMEKMMRQ